MPYELKQAIVADHSQDGKVEVRGADRIKFLQGMLTSDVKALAPGQGQASAFLDAKGKIRALLDVVVLEDSVLIETAPGKAAGMMGALGRFVVADDVELRDRTSDFSVFSVLGPGFEERAPLRGAFFYYEGQEYGVPARRFWTPASEGPRLWKDLTARAAPASQEQMEALRVAAGEPRLGVDVDADTLLMEAPALERRVSFTKGCYLGQETVARIKHRGHVNRVLARLAAEGPQALRPGDAVEGGGAVTSAAGGLALAMLRREAAEPGREVSLRRGDLVLKARVA